MPAIFKVTLPYDYDGELRWYSIANAMKLAEQAGEWLRSCERDHHLVNLYDNAERGLTFVFNDHTTALLFRLSL